MFKRLEKFNKKNHIYPHENEYATCILYGIPPGKANLTSPKRDYSWSEVKNLYWNRIR